MKQVLALLSGCLFALGLLISGMSNPQKVLDFLDIFGQWDASLLFVMIGAIGVAFVPFQRMAARANPKSVFGDTIQFPSNRQIDKNLIVGSALFGMGWGIAGMCPGPALTLIGLGNTEALYFVIAMLVGMYSHKLWQSRNCGE